jgi:hypothetical protein
LPNAVFVLYRYPCRHGFTPFLHRPVAVFGMDYVRPIPTIDLFWRETRIIKPILTGEIEGAIRER